MALSPTLSIVPFIGLNTLCTVADGPDTRLAILGPDGYVGLNTSGDGGNSIVSAPEGRDGSLKLSLLLIGVNVPASDGYVLFAVNNPSGVLGLQNPAQQAYQAGCYDPSQFYPKCTAQISQTQYTLTDATIPPFAVYAGFSSPNIELSPSVIGPVRSYNQYEAINLAGLGNVGQQGCTIVQLVLPPTEGVLNTLLQIDIDFSQTSAS